MKINLLFPVSEWYETKVWKNATQISDTDIKIARAKWNIQRGTRPPPAQKTVLEALQADSNAMDGRDIWVYAARITELDKAGKAALREEQKIRGDDSINCWDVTGEIRDRLPPAGAHVIEFDVRAGTAKFDGIFAVLKENHLINQKGRDINSLRLGNVAAWKAAVARARAAESEQFVAGSYYLREVGEFARTSF